MNKHRLIILILSIAIVILLAQVGLQQFYAYKKTAKFRLDPLEESTLDLPPDFREKKFWIIGDSRANAWDTSFFRFHTATKINLGIGGQSSKQVLERFKNDLEVSHPNQILLQVGINDLKSIGFLKDPNITQNCINNIIKILTICKANNIEVIYTSIFPVGDIEFLRKPLWKKSISDSIVKVNNSIKTYCSNQGMIFFDSHSYLLGNNGSVVKQEFQDDFLHINDEGYEFLSKKLFEQLQQEGQLSRQNHRNQ